jgi:malonyl-CoA O-methyltransferase
MSRKAPAPIDHHAARRALTRALAQGAGDSVLAAEVAARMDERLDLMKIDPNRLLDAGCGTGRAMSLVRARYPKCGIIAIAEVEAELKRLSPAADAGWLAHLFARLGGSSRMPDAVAGELDSLPVSDASVGLVWSNLALHRYVDPQPVFQEMHRVLRDEGLLMFSTLGPDTLMELRRAFARADPGWAHVHDFIDMHDLGDMLIASGFSAPVMDMETITLTYDDVMGLAGDLRAAGAANVLQSRRRGLSGRAMWDRLRTASAALHVNGRLPASFEIVYGHAWKPGPRPAASPQVVQFYPAANLAEKKG